MIHFTCDCCQRTIDPDEETRYVVRLEVYSAVEADEAEFSEQRDHLEEIDDMLERIDAVDEEDPEDDGYRQVRYDLCGECRRAFLKNPLGRLAATKIGFSEN